MICEMKLELDILGRTEEQVDAKICRDHEKSKAANQKDEGE